MDAHKYNGLQRLRKFSVSMFKGWAGTNNTERVNTPPQISSPDQRWRHNAHPQPNTPSGTHLGISNVPHAQQPAAGSRSVPVSPETPRRTNEIGLGDPLQRNELVAKPSNMLASLRGKKVSSKHPNDAHMSGVDRLSKHTLLSATSSATTFGPRELPEGSVSKTRPALLPSGGY
ncbi:hypothetical protein SARC_04581 [Sphaeroforma arctica JP610]|uniref:Uncharacterized protein n=1 Tax=Sphaeroforma arctica JP610 TaxID=667725 RepID=A0A0L0G1Z5_9EUKA|nr:hypothetical protein SARC_04581 [Sphaeroforma arctica JP610]KNC83152.1 hypothetical protein SARC_04581 [Sphaeroforma arctica JP610]|eukprot:XP_014157054.1 hypothetical protein SARC_04581 [Sphaeroforma arctica JP610]